MKIAWCFYGQPRKLELGYKNITDYLKKYNMDDVDFFCHAWYNNNSYLNQSPWSIVREGNIKITLNDLSKIIQLYSPKSYLFEQQKDFNNEITTLKDSLICNYNSNNVSNVLSCCNSTEKTINLLRKYVIENNVNYNYVFISRYDFLKPIKLDITNISEDFVYSTDIHYKVDRFIPSPALLCGGYIIIEKIIKDIYSNIFLYKNDEQIKNAIEHNFKEKFKINHEEIILCNIYYNKLDLFKTIKFTDKIPNFI